MSTADPLTSGLELIPTPEKPWNFALALLLLDELLYGLHRGRVKRSVEAVARLHRLDHGRNVCGREGSTVTSVPPDKMCQT